MSKKTGIVKGRAISIIFQHKVASVKLKTLWNQFNIRVRNGSEPLGCISWAEHEVPAVARLRPSPRVARVVRCRDAHQLDHGCREARFHFLSLGVETLLAEKLLAGLDFMSNCSLNCVRMCGRCGGFLG